MRLITIIFLIFFCQKSLYPENIKVGVWHNPPLSIIDTNTVNGFAPDIFGHIADDNNIEYTFIKGKWQDLYRQLENGEIDIFMPIGYSEERLKTMDFSLKPIFTNWGQIITNNKGKQINDISGLNNSRLAIQKNDLYFYGPYGLYHIMKSFNFNYKIVDVDNYLEAVDKLLKKEVDAALVAKSFTFIINNPDIKITNIIVQPVGVHFAYRKGLDKSIKDKIDNELSNLVENQNSYYYKHLQYLYDTGYSKNIFFTYFFIKYGFYFTLIFVILILMLVIFNKILKKRVLEKTLKLTKTVEQLKNSEEKLNAILSSVPSIIFIIDKNHTYIDVLTSRNDLLLMPREAIIGKKVEDIFDAKQAEFFIHYIDDVILNKAKVNFLYDIILNGTTRYFEAMGVPFEVNSDTFALFQVVEQTDLIIANNSLRNVYLDLSAERDKLNRILNSIKEMVLLIDKNGIITYLNNAAKEFIPENYINSSIAGIDLYNFNDDSKYKLEINKIIENSYSGEILKNIYIKKDDKKIIIEGSIQPIFDYQSYIYGFVLVMRNITEEKRINDQLIKADKIEAIGRLAAGIAHDFNNYLGAIQNYINVLKIKDDEEISNIVQQIDIVIEKSKTLSKQLLTFAKGGSPIMKQTCITDIIKHVSEFSLKGSNITLKLNFSHDCLSCMIDEGLFSQVISNIIINAREAMNDKGVLTINLSIVELKDENEYGIKGGAYAKISIKDTGPGIPDEIKDKIFEPFYTTKSTGTGLGLATSLSIVTQHKGYINFVNHPDGCEFIILLETLTEKECKTKKEHTKETFSKPIDRKIKILYMDDEEFLRDSFELLMSALNCKVDTFIKGEDVLKAIKKEQYDIIVLDLTIRDGMNGVQTIKELKNLDVKSYFVVSSGYSDDPVMQNLKDHGFDDYLLKPYSIKEAKDMLDRFFKHRRTLDNNE